jgi:hypothetical protein
MSEKRVLVLTGYTDSIRDKNSDDAYMKDVFDITLRSKVDYAKTHNYDFMALRSFGKDIRNIFDETKIGQLRFLRAVELLYAYDAVMWIDADSLITNFEYKLESFIDSSVTFAASYDWSVSPKHKTHELNGWGGPGYYPFSTGNFIVQKTSEINKLVDNFYKIGSRFNSEQEALNVLALNKIHDGIKILDHKYLGATPTKQQYAQGWETRQEPYGSWNSESFLVHITGVSNNRRIDILNSHFKDFL